MTDWLAQISGVGSALSGLDMAMPGDGDIPLLGLAYWAYELSTSILNGTVPVDRLNDMVTRIVATWYSRPIQMQRLDPVTLGHCSHPRARLTNTSTSKLIMPLWSGIFQEKESQYSKTKTRHYHCRPKPC
jgi:hypothetical protein